MSELIFIYSFHQNGFEFFADPCDHHNNGKKMTSIKVSKIKFRQMGDDLLFGTFARFRLYNCFVINARFS
jgi:hypothetical protein